MINFPVVVNCYPEFTPFYDRKTDPESGQILLSVSTVWSWENSISQQSITALLWVMESTNHPLSSPGETLSYVKGILPFDSGLRT